MSDRREPLIIERKPGTVVDITEALAEGREIIIIGGGGGAGLEGHAVMNGRARTERR